MHGHLGEQGSRRLTLALLGVAWAAAALVLLVTSAAGIVLDRSFGDFSRDAVVVLDGPAYVGFLSNVGAVAWSLGCGACLVAVLVLDGEPRRALACGGLLTAVLLADDVFLIHEGYLEGSLGLPTIVVPALYAALALAYIVVFRGFLRRHDLWLLLLAGGFLALSAVIDVWFEEDSRFLAEDGTKLVGIFTWTTFFVAATVIELRSSSTATPAAA